MVALALVVLALSPLLASHIGKAANCAAPSTGHAPLTDLASGTYHGYQGGLYPGGKNNPPLGHHVAGVAAAHLVLPLAPAGLPSPAGHKVFLSIGMSNAKIEFDAFMKRVAADPLRDPRLVLVNGAAAGESAGKVSDASSTYWPQVDQRLQAAGVTADQVEVVWLKEAIQTPHGAFPTDAQNLADDLEAILNILGQRFPRLRLVYISSRIYGGYANITLNPEPYAYQSGFAVKWVVQNHLTSSAASLLGHVWIGWGPYLWADGMHARSDGLTWRCDDFAADGTHPSAKGAAKVADLLLKFVHSDVTAKIWYLG